MARIRLRRGWFAAVCHLSKGFKSLRSARKSVAYCQTQLALVRESVHLYQELEFASTEVARQNFAFQPLLNLKHMAPSPPRAVRLLSRDEALDELEQVLRQLDCLCLRLPLVTNLSQLQHVLIDFGVSIHPQPGAIPRSFLRIMLWSDCKILGSQGSMVQWVRESMLEYMLPESTLATTDAADFIAQAAKVILNLCITWCYNLGRQRRRMARNMDDWVQLQLPAEKLDQAIFLAVDGTGRRILSSPSGAYFTGWLLDQVLIMMIRYLELGFQLRLYAGLEYSMLYWYLDYLLGVRLNCQVSRSP